MTKAWFLRLILGCLLWSLPAHAQTFEDGYQSYVRNQFPVAELQFKNALKRASADEERSFILKFIGICQYMRGDKKNSQQSFTQALTLDRNVQIDADEVLDPTVVSFFNSIKSRLGPELKKKPKPAAVAKAQPAMQPAIKEKDKEKDKDPPPPKKTRVVRKKSKGEDSILGLDSNVVVEDKSRRLHFTQFLPFGFPQFHHDSYWLGGGVAILQIASLYSVIDTNNTLAERHKLNRVVQEKPGLTDQQRLDFFAENDKFIGDLNSKKNLALAAFGTIWAASIVESLLHKSSPSKSLSDLPTPPQQSIRPIVQANRQGGTFGLSWETQLK